MARRRTPEEVAWLMENVPKYTEDSARERFQERFGWLPSLIGWQSWNTKHHVHQRGGRYNRNRIVERRVRWSEEPEMEAWMLENDRGQPVSELSEAFRERFGFGLVQTQVSGFRMSHGTQSRHTFKGNAGRWDDKPVGSEVEGKNGYIKVKVAERTTVPGSRNNWRFKHHLVWEQANGRQVPSGHDIMFGDGDITNLDPANLVAVPHRMQGQLKNFQYRDADGLRAAVALCEVQTAITDRLYDRACKICGNPVDPDGTRRQEDKRKGKGMRLAPVLCKRCYESGAFLKYDNLPTVGTGVCKVCGSEFEMKKRSQKRCRKCQLEKPRHSWKAQRGRHG